MRPTTLLLCLAAACLHAAADEPNIACSPGHSIDAARRACAPCAAGTFSATGVGECTPCLSDITSAAGATACGAARREMPTPRPCPDGGLCWPDGGAPVVTSIASGVAE